MGQQWERSLFCHFQLLVSYWEVHWLKLAPGLKKVPWGKTTPHNIFFRPILPNFEKKLKSETVILGGVPCSQSVRQAPNEVGCASFIHNLCNILHQQRRLLLQKVAFEDFSKHLRQAARLGRHHKHAAWRTQARMLHITQFFFAHCTLHICEDF